MYKRQRQQRGDDSDRRDRGLTTVAPDADPAADHGGRPAAVSYTHLRAHETVLDIVCRLLLEKQKHQLQCHVVTVIRAK